MRLPTLAAAAGALIIAAGPAAGSASAAPFPGPGPDVREFTAAELAASISQLQSAITQLEPAIQELDTETTDGGETVISLTTDVLFDFDKSELPPQAPAKIEEVLAPVPQGTSIRVEGHTDSMGGEDYNQTLSEARAEAVAAAIREVRPDLQLEVRGFGESQPVAPNEQGGQDNPDGRAQNRRVEIRYAA